jgi:NAD(P)-dependent dehydrogenase (short-subunit alcohol dehydrogenase family)
MVRLGSFGSGLNVVVAGASGGIASAFVRDLSEDPSIANLHALSREAPADLPTKATFHSFDLMGEGSMGKVVEVISHSGPIHVVIIATGVLHGAAFSPEKSWAAINAESMMEVFRINTIGPALAAKHLLPLMARDRKTCIAALSARVGSISDNRLGGWYSYRASKAALNQIIRCLAIESDRRSNHTICMGLHPGTVDTNISKPFQRSVQGHKLFTPDYAAQKLLNVIDQCGDSYSGRIFSWDGSEIAP